MVDWIIRVVKGILIGTGFIVPGISGGALAAVFGIYEKMIAFFSNIFKDFKKNLLFFIPIGIGLIGGIFLSAAVLDAAFEKYATELQWLFIGCIVGTVPALWKESGKKGRAPKHFIVLAISFVAGMAFLLFVKTTQITVPQNIGTWLMAGGLIGLGMLVPGLSPSNFLLFFGMYQGMTNGIKNLDLSVIVPLFGGVAIVVILFSKVMAHVLDKAYAGMYHLILGIVFASTVMIVPVNVNYLSVRSLIYLAMLAVGVLIGAWMCKLETKYKTSDEPETSTETQ